MMISDEMSKHLATIIGFSYTKTYCDFEHTEYPCRFFDPFNDVEDWNSVFLWAIKNKITLTFDRFHVEATAHSGEYGGESYTLDCTADTIKGVCISAIAMVTGFKLISDKE